MRNIWKFAVRCVVFSGMAIGLATGVVSTSPSALAQGHAPKVDATFSDIKITPYDRVLGKADAPVTIVEYASLTCPHCASFHNKEIPPLKKAYIETGKVRLVYRDFPLDRLALAGSVLARCFDSDRYFPILGVLFEDQHRWARSKNPMKSLSQIARLGGMGQTKLESCFKDKALQEAILKQRLHGSKTFKISSTPTLIVNGQKYNGGLTFAQLKAIIDPMLPKK
jgi:protein-disulfide isomerase